MADEDFNPDMPSWLAGNPLAAIAPSAPSAPPVPSNSLVAGPGLPSSPDVSAIKARMWGQESGHRQFNPDGSVVTSPTGALGYTQVEPSTGPEAAKLAGLPWDEQRLKTDTEYNKALGNAYYDEQLRVFGDPIKAAAAYNAGPGAVNTALMKAQVTGKPWTSFLPEETQNYVKVASGQGGGGGGGGGGGNSSPGGNVQTASVPSGPAAQSDQMRGLMQMALIQAAFPQHKLTPIDYDPWKVRPVVGGEVS